MTSDTVTQAMALNLADWMSASLHPFAVECFADGALWWRQPGGSGIYLGATNVGKYNTSAEFVKELAKVVAAWGEQEFALYDCWGNCDLAAAGFTRLVQNPWYWRAAGPLVTNNDQLPPGLRVERVTTADELQQFERASWVGFEENEEMLATRPAYSSHAMATLANPNMHYLVARLDGQVVAGVIAHATADVLGIYGLSTLLPYRRRGYATALIRAAVALRPELPACVFPDPPSVPIYTQIGFVPAGEIAIWQRNM